MSTDSTPTIAVIGAGLVGGALLKELALVWISRQGKTPAQFTKDKRDSLSGLHFDHICITARSVQKLSHQLDKIQIVLQLQEDIHLHRADPLQLVVSKAGKKLQIDAETLEIIPSALNSMTIEDEHLRTNSPLFSFLETYRPCCLVVGVNLASVVAYGEALEGLRSKVLAWIMTTLKQAADQLQIETMAFLGTTGLGGMGTNMPWTHQSSQEMDPGLTNKVLSAYGTLGVLDRLHWDTDCSCRFILLTPGSVLGYDYLEYGPVRFFSIPGDLPLSVEKVVRGNELQLPLYEPIEIDLHSLSDRLIDWESRRIKGAFLTGAKIKCGENGEFSPMQFAGITHPFQMGFNSGTYIARILLDELAGKATGFNQIPLGAGKVVEPSSLGQNDCRLALARMAELELQNDRRSPPVYPALGSPRAQKEIVMADLVYRVLTHRFGKPTLQQLSDFAPEELATELWRYLQENPLLFAEITAVIPVVSPSGRIHVGPHAMYLGHGIKTTSDLELLCNDDSFREFAALGAVDLRPQAESIRRKSKMYETGVNILIERAQFILAGCVNGVSMQIADQCGSSLDHRITYWMGQTTGSETLFDPVFFTVQFLGGERPFV